MSVNETIETTGEPLDAIGTLIISWEETCATETFIDQVVYDHGRAVATGVRALFTPSSGGFALSFSDSQLYPPIAILSPAGIIIVRNEFSRVMEEDKAQVLSSLRLVREMMLTTISENFSSELHSQSPALARHLVRLLTNDTEYRIKVELLRLIEANFRTYDSSGGKPSFRVNDYERLARIFLRVIEVADIWGIDESRQDVSKEDQEILNSLGVGRLYTQWLRYVLTENI